VFWKQVPVDSGRIIDSNIKNFCFHQAYKSWCVPKHYWSHIRAKELYTLITLLLVVQLLHDFEQESIIYVHLMLLQTMSTKISPVSIQFPAEPPLMYIIICCHKQSFPWTCNKHLLKENLKCTKSFQNNYKKNTVSNNSALPQAMRHGLDNHCSIIIAVLTSHHPPDHIFHSLLVIKIY
jgi:hypothetical protein